jgi:hypothetical protein
LSGFDVMFRHRFDIPMMLAGLIRRLALGAGRLATV